MGQEGGEKWTAAADLQPTPPKSDRLLVTFPDTAVELGEIADMEKHHVLRLDWATSNENGDARTPPDDRNYIQRMFTLSGLL